MLVGVGRVGGVGRSSGRAGVGGGPVGKTYADWVAHVNAVSGGFDASAWGTRSIVNPVGNRIYRTTATTAPFAGMLGTSYNSYFVYDSDMRAVVQHGLPSQAAFNEQVANSGVMLVTLGDNGEAYYFAGINRNGLQTTTYEDGFLYRAVVASKLSFWNFSLGKPQTLGPSYASAAVDYAAPGW